MVETSGMGRSGVYGGGQVQRSVGEWQRRIGTVLTDADRVQLKVDFGSVRIITPSAMVTMDFRPGRLNVNVDKGGVIFGFSWG